MKKLIKCLGIIILLATTDYYSFRRVKRTGCFAYISRWNQSICVFNRY
ncbi:MAG: hypothetical protein GX461_08065 [Clostridiales bacterium]|nr:hypothetical protein [Clostridiales bacterium]